MSMPRDPVPVPTQTIAGARIGPEGKLLIIAGLCVLEEEEGVLRHARALRRLQDEHPQVHVVFKASFDKANRSSMHSPRGPGLRPGLRMLEGVRGETGLPLLTDVHLPDHCAPVGEVVDILQIPAFLCRQTDLLVAAARTGRCVNVKKGQFLAPWEMKGVLGKLREAGAQSVLLTERGSQFGYNMLVNDFRSLPWMRDLGAPVVFDATHSVQRPGGLGDRSGGDRRMVPYLARAAAAVGVDGFFFEVHEDPSQARSDGPNALHLEDLGPLLRQLLAIKEALDRESGPPPRFD